jgi:hypothetical protein
MSNENKRSIEELLSMVEEKSKPKRKIENNVNVMRFIQETGLEPGTLVVPTYVLFWYYRNVWPGDRHSKAKKIVFFRTLKSQNFPCYRVGKQRYYLIKEGLIELTDEVIKQAKIYDKQFWAKKEPKTVQSVEQTGNSED